MLVSLVSPVLLDSVAVSFLNQFWQIDEVEAAEIEDKKGDLNLYYSFAQINQVTEQYHMDWIKCGYATLPTKFLNTDNIYFGMHLAGEYNQTGRLKTDIIYRVSCLFADFDGKDMVDTGADEYQTVYDELYSDKLNAHKASGLPVKPETETNIAKRCVREAQKKIFKANRGYYMPLLLERVKENTKDKPPSIMVCSGGGYHCYWLLNTPQHLTDSAEREAHKIAQKNFVRAIGADRAASGMAQILRVPGTLNTKYTDNNVVTIVEDNGRRYSYSELLAEKLTVSKSPTFLVNMPQLPGAVISTRGKRLHHIPEATKAVLNELYPNPLEIFRNAGYFTTDDELQHSGDDWRIPGYHGLLVVKEGQTNYGSWHCFNDGYGGGVVHAYLWANKDIKLGADGSWLVEDHNHYLSACVEMLKEKGVFLDANNNVLLSSVEVQERIDKFMNSDNPINDFPDPTDYISIVESLFADRKSRYDRTQEASVKTYTGKSLFNIDELSEYDKTEDEVIERFATRGEVTMFYAPSATGKSYLCVELAISLILGKQVLQQLTTRSKTKKVLYLAAETDPDFKNRVIRTIGKLSGENYQTNYQAVKENLIYVSGKTNQVRFDEPFWVKEIAAELLHKYEKQGQLFDLIILDTLRASVVSGVNNESDSGDMGKIMKIAQELGLALGNAAVIVIHHTNKGEEEFSGSYALFTNINTVLSAQQINGVIGVMSEKNKQQAKQTATPILTAKFATDKNGGAYLEYTEKGSFVPRGKSLSEQEQTVLGVVKNKGELQYAELSDLLVAETGLNKSDSWIEDKLKYVRNLAHLKYINVEGLNDFKRGSIQSKHKITILPKGLDYFKIEIQEV
jgi:hypothetical protein